MTAAIQLQKRGYVVTLLEARERIGGRVHSMATEEGGVVELGAAVLMGVQGGNPLAALCRQHGVRMHRVRRRSQQNRAPTLEAVQKAVPTPARKICRSRVLARPTPCPSQLSNACPLHDGSGGKLLPPETDQQVEQLFNQLLEEAGKERQSEAEGGAQLTDPHVGLETQLEWQGKWYRAKVTPRHPHPYATPNPNPTPHPDP